MSRRKQAPDDLDCPYRHRCPHLDHMATGWVLENYHEAQELREQLYALEQRSEQRIAALMQTLTQRDQKIAQLQLQHQKQFKANRPRPVEAAPGKARKRGAPVGHPPWRRRELGPVDRVMDVPPPVQCPHCQGHDLEPCPEVYPHVQEDLVLPPRGAVTRFVHQQVYCRTCRRVVYQVGPGEIPGCQIGPLTRAVATHLRYNLQIPYRKVRHLFTDLFGMPLVPATAISFDRKAAARGKPLYEELRVMLQSSPVVYADETSWREDGLGAYVWFGGHQDLAFFQIADRSADSAVLLLGEDFGGTLVSDAYAAYNAVHASSRQTCWSHLRRHCKDLLQQIELTRPTLTVPKSVRFLTQIKRLSEDLCDLGRQLREGTLPRAAARARIPSLEKRLERIAGKPMDYAPAETLRQRLMEKDRDKLFTFLRLKGVEPTNNHSERSVRPHVIMRKICNGTRSPAGSESHAILPSLLQTAQRQGKPVLPFLYTLITQPLNRARAALFANSS